MSARTRRYALLWHRYAGLFMAAFLALAGLTGSLLAFRPQIDRWLSPQLYATPRPGVPPLDLQTLIDRAQGLVPHARIGGVVLQEDQALIQFTPEKDPATGKPYKLGFTRFVVDPWTGKELGRWQGGDQLSNGRQNFTLWLLHLHDRFLTGPGYLFMGIVALVWTIDCFIAFYLTVPPMWRGFWRQWKPAWQIKSNLGAYRLNLDLHRAFGLWLWPIIFVFAWSSVMFNLRIFVYEPVMQTVFDYESPIKVMMDLSERAKANRNAEMPLSVDWRRAESTGHALLEAKGRERGFAVGESTTIGYIPPFNMYVYGAGTSPGPAAAVMFEENGTVLRLDTPTGNRTGNTVEMWLQMLHMGHDLGLWYQAFVAFLGVVIAMFSVTGVYLWWQKRKVRRKRKERSPTSAAEAVA
ncbi:MAG: PepSY-associated TM helix domain-containing protein [Vicinamibacterales bacterium]